MDCLLPAILAFLCPLVTSADPEGSQVRPSISAGMPVGGAHVPAAKLGDPYTGALRAAHWRKLPKLVDSVAGVGGRVILTPVRQYIRNSRKQYDAMKFRAQIDSLASAIDWRHHIANGTLLGVMILDEPNCAACWGGRKITYAEVEDAARYTKQRLDGVPILVRVVPWWWPRHGAPRYVDAAWAQWEGPLHVPSARMSPKRFRDKAVREARARGLSLVLGLNALDGGDGSSGRPGTYDLRRVRDRWQMSAREIERVGTTFAAAPVCAIISWRWSPDFPANRYFVPEQLASIRDFDRRRDVQEAWAKVVDVARRQPARSCAKGEG